jgi:peroxiredoxin
MKLAGLLLVIFIFSAVIFALEPSQKAADFTLKDTSGKEVQLSNHRNENVVLIFVSTKCPYSNAFNSVMAKLADDYSSKGIVFLGINSNQTESVDQIAKHAKDNGLSFPILKDPENKVADLYGAQVTPEAFVIDKSGAVRYHGALGSSGRPTTDPAEATSNEIRAALDELLAGKEIAKAKTKAFGCTIKRVG